MASLKYWLWLTNLEGLTIQQRLALLEHFGQPDKVYFGDSGEYALVEGMTRQAMAALTDKSLDGADKILGDCQSLGLRIITIQDAEYPDRLRNIYDPPLVLYVQGRMPAFDDEVAIAMVGSRKVSPYAQMMGEKLAFQMAGLGALIVSGLAAGRIGKLLHDTAAGHQVLCITHTPQVAAFADNQLLIQKNVRDGRTYTQIHTLDMDGRVRALAAMISGDNVTDLSLANAREMIEKSK